MVGIWGNFFERYFCIDNAYGPIANVDLGNRPEVQPSMKGTVFIEFDEGAVQILVGVRFGGDSVTNMSFAHDEAFPLLLYHEGKVDSEELTGMSWVLQVTKNISVKVVELVYCIVPTVTSLGKPSLVPAYLNAIVYADLHSV